MWYPAEITQEAESEPLTVDETKRHVRATDFADDDAYLTDLIAAARDHVERYCNIRLATQTVEIKCDEFCDFSRLPEGPVQSIASISYIDPDGTQQTIASSDYESRPDGLDASIVLNYGASWPPVRQGSRITVTAIVGYDKAPPAIKHAMLLFIGDAYQNREDAAAAPWSAFDALLSNYRRG